MATGPLLSDAKHIAAIQAEIEHVSAGVNTPARKARKCTHASRQVRCISG
jgi:hypothetical protein